MSLPSSLPRYAKSLCRQPYITEQDMYRGGLPQAVVDYFKQVLPPKEDGYDYTGFVEGAFVI